MSEFNPNWASAPGETIAAVLEQRGLSLETFSRRIGVPLEQLQELLTGRQGISLSLARALHAELGASIEFWMSRDFRYRQLASRVNDPESRAWLAQLPISDMMRLKWIPAIGPEAEVSACLRFFGVSDLAEWASKYATIQHTAAFRSSTSFESKPEAVAAWLRKGEIEAESIDCKRWDKSSFQASLSEARKLTKQKNPKKFIPALVSLCAASGVAVTVVRTPSGCPASGATRFISERKAILQLSFRFLADDHFWFTFFHEAGHLLLHGTQKLFVEGVGASSAEEKEANGFAEDILVPRDTRTQMMKLRYNADEVLRFAQRIGIAPGIVVGQMQFHKRIRHGQLENLKRRYEWE